MSGTLAKKPTELDPKKFNCHDTHIVSVYTVCSEAQDEFAQKLEAEMSTSDRTSLERDLMLVRLNGHLLTHAPTRNAQYNLAREVLSTPSEPGTSKINAQVLAAVGDKYYKNFIRLFRRNKGPTPNPSNYPSRPSYDRRKEENLPLLKPNKLDHRGAKAATLLRDDNRCMITRQFDSTIFEQSSDEFRAELSSANQRLCATECCHIFPESTNRGIDDKSKGEYAATMWTIIERFGYPKLRTELEGQEIHSLKNVLTLNHDARGMFDTLRLWFEETDIRHCYKIGANDPTMVFSGYRFPREVQFKTTDERLDLPDPRLLKLHAACCKVAWMSGAAGYMDELDRKRDDYDPYEPVAADTLSALLSKLPTAPVDMASSQPIAA